MILNMSSDTVRVIATVKVKADQVEAVKAILTELVRLTLVEDGCLQYELLQNQQDQCEFIFVEAWTSQIALNKHLETEHLQKALRDTAKLLVSPPDIRQYQQLL